MCQYVGCSLQRVRNTRTHTHTHCIPRPSTYESSEFPGAMITRLLAWALQCHASALQRASWYVPQDMCAFLWSSRANRPHSKPNREKRYTRTDRCSAPLPPALPPPRLRLLLRDARLQLPARPRPGRVPPLIGGLFKLPALYHVAVVLRGRGRGGCPLRRRDHRVAPVAREQGGGELGERRELPCLGGELAAPPPVHHRPQRVGHLAVPPAHLGGIRLGGPLPDRFVRDERTDTAAVDALLPLGTGIGIGTGTGT